MRAMTDKKEAVAYLPSVESMLDKLTKRNIIQQQGCQP